MAEFTTLRIDTSAPVARLTLARPERLNALSPRALEELVEAAGALSAAEGVKVVVVAGEGRAFCAGFDIDAAGAGRGRDDIDAGRRMAEAIDGMRPLTIAAIHGHCVGGGLVLAAACDLRIAAEGTRFAIPEVDLGIPLAWGGVPRLVRELGPAVTKELVLTCRPFTAAEAHALRFVNRVVPDAGLAAEADALAASLAAKPELLLRQTLQLVDAVVEEAYPTRQSFRDADITLAAIGDPECRATMARYLEAHGRSRAD